MEEIKDLLEQNWDDIKANIKKINDIPNLEYKMWIAPLKFYDYKDKVLTLSFQYYDDDEILSYISNNYKECIQDALASLFSEKIEVNFIFLKYVSDYIKPVSSELPSKYNFDNWITSTNNRMAYNACLNNAKWNVTELNNAYGNPLLIYGEAGLGKTHLLTAIGNYICENSKKKVCFFTAHDFLLEYRKSCCMFSPEINDEMDLHGFRKTICSADVLLIDDINYFVNVNSTARRMLAEEFVSIINTMLNNNKLVVLTSDSHPFQMLNISSECRACLSGFMIVDLKMPEYKTRVEILKEYAKRLESDISHEIIEYIAGIITTSITVLKCAFNQVYTKSKLDPENWNNDLESAKEVLKDVLSWTSQEDDKDTDEEKTWQGNRLLNADEWKEIKIMVKDRCNGTEEGYYKFIEPLEQGGFFGNTFRIIVPEYVPKRRFGGLGNMFKEEFRNVLKEELDVEYKVEFIFKKTW